MSNNKSWTIIIINPVLSPICYAIEVRRFFQSNHWSRCYSIMHTYHFRWCLGTFSRWILVRVRLLRSELNMLTTRSAAVFFNVPSCISRCPGCPINIQLVNVIKSDSSIGPALNQSSHGRTKETCEQKHDEDPEKTWWPQHGLRQLFCVTGHSYMCMRMVVLAIL
jgi:hypothetical protein